MNLKEKIISLEKQMVLKLEELRATHRHKGIKGTGVEQTFRDFLGQYLPRRFAVGEGEVVDMEGRVSPQTDVVIAGEDHPFTFPQDGPGLFFIEGVIAAGEIKSLLNGAELTNSFANSQAFNTTALDR